MYPEFRTPGFKPRAFARGQWGITWPRDPLTRGSLTPGASPGTTVSHPRARAPPIDYALLALRAPCDADAAPMQDEGVREPGPLVARHQRHQVALDLLRCFLFRETEQRRQALHVRVHHDPFTLPEPGAQHHVRGLAPHPGELDQLLHGIRHLAPVALQERLRHPDDRFRLVAEEPGAVNILLEDLGIRRGVVLRRLVLREQRRGDDVDPSVRGLSREDRRDEQLERVRVVERAHGVGVGPLEAGDDLADARPGFCGRLAPMQGPSLPLRWYHRQPGLLRGGWNLLRAHSVFNFRTTRTVIPSAEKSRAPARSPPSPRRAGRAQWRARPPPCRATPRAPAPTRSASDRRCPQRQGYGGLFPWGRSCGSAPARRSRPGSPIPPPGSGR